MSDWLTPERIAEMQQWILDYPIDPQYDEACNTLDSDAPSDQLASRAAYRVLKRLGKLPPGIE